MVQQQSWYQHSGRGMLHPLLLAPLTLGASGPRRWALLWLSWPGNGRTPILKHNSISSGTEKKALAMASAYIPKCCEPVSASLWQWWNCPRNDRNNRSAQLKAAQPNNEKVTIVFLNWCNGVKCCNLAWEHVFIYLFSFSCAPPPIPPVVSRSLHEQWKVLRKHVENDFNTPYRMAYCFGQ